MYSVQDKLRIDTQTNSLRKPQSDNFQELAQQSGIKRIIQSLLKENLVAFSYINNQLLITLSSANSFLIITNVEKHSLSRYFIKGSIYQINLESAEQVSKKKITKVEDLLKILEKEFYKNLEIKQWKIFIEEVQNNIDNTQLATDFCEHANQALIQIANRHRYHTLWELVFDEKLHVDPVLFFEQWASRGHPYHPCNKTKLGFLPHEVSAYSPEFDSIVHVVLGAIHKDEVVIAISQDTPDYKAWFAEVYPEWYQAWVNKLEKHHLSEKDFFPIPMHPWQAKKKIPTLFSTLLEKNKLYIFDDVKLATKPTLSFRTVIPLNSRLAHHIKLPVAVHSTSALRTISPASIQNSPQISEILKNIVERENNFDNKLRILSDGIGLRVKHENSDIAKHLSVLFRENPYTKLDSKEIAIVASALFEISPISKKPLLIELAHSTGINTSEEAIQYFSEYCNIILSTYLDLYIKYGIAMEAHQQNTLLVFEKGMPVATIARDLGGLRIDQSRLEKHGFSISPFPGSATITNDTNEVRNKLIHTVYQFHLGEIVLLFYRYFGIEEKTLWDIIANITQERFEKNKQYISEKVFSTESDAILKNDWPIKSLLSMRLNNTYSKYIYAKTENPMNTYIED